MYRLVQSCLVALLLLGASAFNGAVFAEQPQLPSAANTDFQYPDTPVYRIECAEMVIHYQRKPGCPITMDRAVRMVEEGRDRVLLFTGKPIGETVRVYFPDEIHDHGSAPEANLTTFGIRFNVESQNCVALRRNSSCVDLAAHELLHAWFRAHKVEPVRWWIEEGACEAIEEPDLFNSRHWDLLHQQQPMSLGELDQAQPGNADNDRIRATAWLLCYHARFVHPNRLSLVEFAKTEFDRLVDPFIAFEEVKRYLWERQSAESLEV